MTKHDRVAALILSHGRPDRVLTFNSLRRSNWSHPIYIVIDNEDAKGDEYRKRFGDEMVIEFDKKAIAETFDTADTQDDRRAIVYARNACWQIARDLGLDYQFQLDDDYTSFAYRWVPDVEGDSTQPPIRSLDAVVDEMMTFLDTSGALAVAMSQGGDHIGGIDAWAKKEPVKRKAMNSFVLRTDREFTFVGRINEDVNSYVTYGSRGDLFLSVLDLQLTQQMTQTNSGGMTDLYTDTGTYLKSFYTVMMNPSCVTVKTMGYVHPRLHHAVRWENAVPKIISDIHRKV